LSSRLLTENQDLNIFFSSFELSARSNNITVKLFHWSIVVERKVRIENVVYKHQITKVQKISFPFIEPFFKSSFEINSTLLPVVTEHWKNKVWEKIFLELPLMRKKREKVRIVCQEILFRIKDSSSRLHLIKKICSSQQHCRRRK